MAAGLLGLSPQTVMSAGRRISPARVQNLAQRQNTHTKSERGDVVDDRRENGHAQTDEHPTGSLDAEGSEPLQDGLLGEGAGRALRDGAARVLDALQRGRQTGAVSVTQLLHLVAAFGESNKAK